ncbi:hypothetical protein RPMA_18960 [Tardiphaga alba]|uniref:Uncharacterized protein n=1 Tax=Tardiphaga alba TaxID=340268 RepID=A0ABX8AA80_9BRAD|nr:hypothetical protein [Tardiphaga alba]QUS40679.1 hypothetical protein RPMA_18960 [Tardiphaga alba]
MSIQDFSDNTKANIEIALDRACSLLPGEKASSHETRAYIAQQILDAAHNGHRTLTKLTEAGRQAVVDLRSAH